MQTNRICSSIPKTWPVAKATTTAPAASLSAERLRYLPEAYHPMHREMSCKAAVNFKTKVTLPDPAQAKPPSLVVGLRALLGKLRLYRKVSVALTGFAENQVKVYLAEIGLVTTAAGYYNLHLGGNPESRKLNHVYKYHLPESQVLTELSILLANFKKTGKTGERFGDFVTRTNLI